MINWLNGPRSYNVNLIVSSTCLLSCGINIHGIGALIKAKLWPMVSIEIIFSALLFFIFLWQLRIYVGKIQYIIYNQVRMEYELKNTNKMGANSNRPRENI